MASKLSSIVPVCLLLLALFITVYSTSETGHVNNQGDSQAPTSYGACRHDSDCIDRCSNKLGGKCNYHVMNNNTCSCNECLHDWQCSGKNHCNFGGKCIHYHSSGTSCACY